VPPCMGGAGFLDLCEVLPPLVEFFFLNHFVLLDLVKKWQGLSIPGLQGLDYAVRSHDPSSTARFCPSAACFVGKWR
jgi:hypothetical protein